MADNGLWVFGYGSLMWEPGFEVSESQIARLGDYHRSFCMWSIHHRGTPEHPGLVLALDARTGAYCDGVALFVRPEKTDQTLAYLRERELVSSAYLEVFCRLSLRDGREVEAVTYIVDPDHVQYCGTLSLDRQAEVISDAVGGRGPNTEYLSNTAAQLHKLGIHDPELDLLVEKVDRLKGQN
ncbi:MAG: gamma-glutamylcyclotransferase [Pseudomonadota bacterium]